MAVNIDLNSDLGEHPDRSLDEQIMPHISSCNIACGGHAGDEASVKATIALAINHQVAIGAHPSYPDKENFGRQVMLIDEGDLFRSLHEQILLVKSTAEVFNVPLHHIKPHGALYNKAAVDADISKLICEVVKSIDPELKLYGLAHSITEATAEKHDIHFIGESFADRRYNPDKTLKSRKFPDAVLTSTKDVLAQVEELVLNKRAFASDWISIESKTVCLHSDTKGAVTLAKRIHEHLVSKGVNIAAV